MSRKFYSDEQNSAIFVARSIKKWRKKLESGIIATSLAVMQEIGAIGKEHDLEINCIPNNMEKYVAFMLGRHLVFMDSFQFTAGSLEQLADNLPADKFKYTCQVFQDEELALMKNKGVYRYDYMDRSLVTNSCLLRIVSQSLKYVVTGNTS